MVVTGVWATLGAELLSFGHHLRFPGVLAWWTVPTAALLVLAGLRRNELRAWLSRPAPLDRTTAVLIALCASILLITGYIAATCPTNTWDCWQYHLPRVFHWVQQGSVANFPAHDRRQLEMPPMAEMLSAHWWILSGGDRWSNMHQWLAFLGAAVAASIAARELGAGGRGQAIAALLALTNPAAATQATNGKNDVVVALWALALAYLAARLWRQRACPPGRAVLIGFALGLLLLTKGTGMLLAAPLCAAIGIAMLRVLGARAVPLGVTIAALALSLNAGHWTRNAREFGSPLGRPQSQGGYPLRTTVYTPGAMISGVVRNLAMHAVTPSMAINHREQGAVEALHEWMGQDPSDPRTTSSPGVHPFKLIDTRFSDGNSPAPVHLAMVLGALGLGAVRPRALRAGPGGGWPALAVPLAAFALFCICVRWQPWHLRLQIPFVLLFAPALGALLPRLRPAPVRGVLVLAAFALTWDNLLWAGVRPLLGPQSVLVESREECLFQQAPVLRESMKAAAAAVAAAGPRVAAVNLRTTSVEYPVLRMVREAVGPGVPIVNLSPTFGPAPDPALPAPDVVFDAEPSPGPLVQRGTHAVFLRRAGFPPFYVLVTADRLRAAMGETATPFAGWEAREGLRPEEGPYPDLPFRARWGRPPRTVLSFSSDGSPAALLLEVRRNERENQQMMVVLNGETLARYDFGRCREFWPARVPLRPRAGENELVLEYRPEAEGFAGRGSVLFKRLEIVTDAAAK